MFFFFFFVDSTMSKILCFRLGLISDSFPDFFFFQEHPRACMGVFFFLFLKFNISPFQNVQFNEICLHPKTFWGGKNIIRFPNKTKIPFLLHCTQCVLFTVPNSYHSIYHINDISSPTRELTWRSVLPKCEKKLEKILLRHPFTIDWI